MRKDAGSWYALQVLTGKEQQTAQLLRDKGIQSIAPVRGVMEKRGGAWTAEYKTAMPGYVFVRCEMTVPLYYHLTGKPGVIRLLGNDEGRFTPIPAEQMWVIGLLSERRDRLQEAGISHGKRLGSGEIEITDGPLLELKDRIVGYDIRRRRARVDIGLYAQNYQIDMALIIDDDNHT